jgi:hypothetical protein
MIEILLFLDSAAINLNYVPAQCKCQHKVFLDWFVAYIIFSDSKPTVPLIFKRHHILSIQSESLVCDLYFGKKIVAISQTHLQ